MPQSSKRARPLLAAFAVFGLYWGCSSGSAAPVEGGSALSTVAILGYLGFLVGPPLIGAVSSASGLRGGFLFLCTRAIVLALCAPLLRESPA